MINARDEFLVFVTGVPAVATSTTTVLAAYVNVDREREITLYPGYSPSRYTEFLEFLDFNYDHGYGSQHVFGTIWFTDGTWATRVDHDGSEWWALRQCPSLPKRQD